MVGLPGLHVRDTPMPGVQSRIPARTAPPTRVKWMALRTRLSTMPSRLASAWYREMSESRNATPMPLPLTPVIWR